MKSLSHPTSWLRVAGTSLAILVFSHLLMYQITLGFQKNDATIKKRVVVAGEWRLVSAKNVNTEASVSEAYVRFTLSSGSLDQGPRVSLRVAREGQGPVIDLEENNGETRVSLGVRPEVSFLQAVRQRGAKEQVGIFLVGNDPTILAERPQGRLSLHISNAGPDPFGRLSCSSTKSGQISMSDVSPYIGLEDSSGSSRTFMYVRPKTEAAGLDFLDGRRRQRFVAGVDRDGDSAVVFFDSAQRVVREIP